MWLCWRPKQSDQSETSSRGHKTRLSFELQFSIWILVGRKLKKTLRYTSKMSGELIEPGKAKAAGITSCIMMALALGDLICGFIYVSYGGPDASGVWSGFAVSFSFVSLYPNERKQVVHVMTMLQICRETFLSCKVGQTITCCPPSWLPKHERFRIFEVDKQCNISDWSQTAPHLLWGILARWVQISTDAKELVKCVTNSFVSFSNIASTASETAPSGCLCRVVLCRLVFFPL